MLSNMSEKERGKRKSEGNEIFEKKGRRSEL